MKPPLWALLLTICLTSLACNLVSGQVSKPTPQETEPAATSTEMIAEDTLSVALPTETQEPSATIAASGTPAPTQTVEVKATATLAPLSSATPDASPTPTGSAEDKFDLASADWGKILIITSQSSQMRSAFSYVKGEMLYELRDKETYAYQINNNELKADVTVQTTFRNLGELNNSVVLVCRAAADNSSWYEARVSNKGSYSFYVYDRALKEKGGRNPYTELVTGGVNYNYLYPNKANVIKLTCKGDTLTLDVNNGLKVFNVKDSTLTQGGLVGLGVLSFEDLDVVVAFDEFKASNLP